MENVISMKSFAKSRFEKLQQESDKVFQLGNKYEQSGASGFAKKCRKLWCDKVPEKAKMERAIKRFESMEEQQRKNRLIKINFS